MQNSQHIRYPSVRGTLSGTTRTRLVLTSSFVAHTNAIIATKYNSHCKLVTDYLPKATNGFCEIQVEVSEDGTNWELLNTNSTYAGTEVDVLGNPFVVPGTKSSAIDTAKQQAIEFDFTAKFLRIKAREASGLTVGELYIEAIIK